MTQARTRNSTLWTEDPKQQIAYLAQKRWARLYCPDVLLGVYTPDELEQPVERFMGDIEEVKPVKAEPVFLSEEKFEKDFDNLADRLRKRLKTVDSMAQYFITRGTPLTDKQIDRLNAVKPNEKEAEPTLRDTATDVVEKPAKSVDHVVPAFTYAQVADAMHAANTHAELEAAAEAIGGFVAPQDRSDLTAIYNERTGKVAPF